MKQGINKKNNTESGFTFVEMIVVISIFAIMGSIALFKFSEFNKRATLDNLAQNVALKIEEAKKSAISGVNNVTFATGIAPAYGMYFSTSTSSSTNKKLIYFADTPVAGGTEGDKIYQTTGGTSTLPCGTSYGAECLSVTSITGGEYISKICYPTGTSTYSCPSSATSAQIVFKRPFPDATMSVCTNPSSCIGYNPLSSAWATGSTAAINTQSLLIEMTSGLDPTLKQTIIATGLGQVRVFNGSATNACLSLGATTCP